MLEQTLAFVMRVAVDDAEVASDQLWSLGVVAVEERTVDATTVELRTSLGNDASVIAHAVAHFPASWQWHLEPIDASVSETWRAFAQPVAVAPSLTICPAWIEPPSDRGDVIVIEPGSTFGLGDHPTTMLSIRHLLEEVSEGCTMLDVGAGSGVLAIVACRRGASGATAIDIATASPAMVSANAERNGVAAQIVTSTAPLADVDGPFDVVCANILAPVLIELAEDLKRVTAPTGALIISGVLADRHDHVQQALAPLRCVRRDTMDGWAVLTLRW